MNKKKNDKKDNDKKDNDKKDKKEKNKKLLKELNKINEKIKNKLKDNQQNNITNIIQNNNENSNNNENMDENMDENIKKKKQILLLQKIKNSLIIISNENNISSSSDYMVEINKCNINNIDIQSFNFPKNKQNITHANNILTIIINDNKKIIELEPDYYNRYDIIECINYAFESVSLNIKIFLENDIFIFKSNIIFSIINEENSICNTLGFNNTSYIDKTMYIGNNILLYDNILYLSFYNLDIEPLFKINVDTNEITKLKEIIPKTGVDYLLLKYYHSLDNIIKNRCDYFYDTHWIKIKID